MYGSVWAGRGAARGQGLPIVARPCVAPVLSDAQSTPTRRCGASLLSHGLMARPGPQPLAAGGTKMKEWDRKQENVEEDEVFGSSGEESGGE